MRSTGASPTVPGNQKPNPCSELAQANMQSIGDSETSSSGQSLGAALVATACLRLPTMHDSIVARRRRGWKLAVSQDGGLHPIARCSLLKLAGKALLVCIAAAALVLE